MSSRASDAIQVELPPRLAAVRVADGLALLAVATIAWVSARYGSAALSVGMTGAAAAILAWAGDAPLPGATWRLAAGPRTRQLGPTLVLEGRSAETGRPVGPVWLTPHDLPRDRLRHLAIRLRADGPTVVS